MGTHASTGLTWADLQHFGEDNVRRELFDGELHVSASPITRHQRVVRSIAAAIDTYVSPLGGEVFGLLLDVVVNERTVVGPDVQMFLPGHLDRIGPRFVEGPPDLVVEVSSPSTKGIDRIRKRAIYEGFGVQEYWIVDLDHDAIEAYRLVEDGYGPPERFGSGDTVTTPLIDGFAEPFERLVPPGAG